MARTLFVVVACFEGIVWPVCDFALKEFTLR